MPDARSIAPARDHTFLFTDIEGSSRLWATYPDAMGAALARHDQITREVVTAFGGAVVKFTGDGVHAVFTEGLAALECASALQQAIQADDAEAAVGKSAPVRLKLRMGIHAGPSEYRDGDYYGDAVNRAARIANAAHGGQVLVSDTLAQLLAPTLAPPLGLRTLGRVRLRDLSGEETLHQLEHPALVSSFPPLRTLWAAPNNLPTLRTSFVGRHHDVRAISSRLSQFRMVTLIGAGGMGKTRLAVQVAARELERFEDGVWLVELARVSEGARVADQLLAALGLRAEPGRESLESLVDYFIPRRALVVIDNCEHVLDDVARLADTLLGRAPHLTVLATSREAIGIDGEAIVEVPGLPLPAPDFGGSLKDLCEVEAVRLFVERVEQVRPDWRDHLDDPRVLARLCYQLDGIPLAIELAAARVRELAIADILRGLEDRFGFLTSANRLAQPRHKTLTGLIDWSFQLLSPPLQTLLYRLSVFRGGIDAELAQSALMPEASLAQCEQALAMLADKSLLTRSQVGEADALKIRYGMLETMRQYSGLKLAVADETVRVQRAHAAAFAAWATPLSVALAKARDGSLSMVLREEENLRSAISFLLTREANKVDETARPDDAELALALGAALGTYWVHVGRGAADREILRDVLRLAGEDIVSRDRALVTHGEAALCYLDADMDHAMTFAKRGLALFQKLGDRDGIARAQSAVAYVTFVQSGYEASLIPYADSEQASRLAGNLGQALMVRMNLAINALYHGDRGRGANAYDSARAECAASNDPRVPASLRQYEGLAALDRGEPEEALIAFTAMREECRMMGVPQRVGVTEFLRGQCLGLLDRLPEALAAFQESITILRDRQVTLELMNGVEAFAGLLAHCGEDAAAIAACTATARVRERLGITPGDQARGARERALQGPRSRLTADAIARAEASGTQAGLAAIVAWLLRVQTAPDLAGGSRLVVPPLP